MLAVLAFAALLAAGGAAWYQNAVSTLSGTVVDAVSQQPLAQTEVRWRDLTVTTDAQGRFSLQGVDRKAQDDPVVVGGGDYETQRIPLGPSGLVVALMPDTVTGLVTDNHRTPIARARISAGNVTAVTDAKGGFTLKGVAQNPALRVVAPGFKTVTVRAGARRQLTVTLDPFTPKGLYIPFAAVSARDVRQSFLRNVERLALNTAVLDITSDRGSVYAGVETGIDRKMDAVVDSGDDLATVLKDLRARNLYVVARMPVFQAAAAAQAHPEWAVRVAANGAPYTDCQGQRWLDPFREEGWDYRLEQAEKAADLGFNEIQFEYARFPSDCVPGPLAYSQPVSDDAKRTAINGFMKRAMERLRPKGVAIAVSVFGMVATDDDMGVGQRLEDLAQYADYICPVVHPSTWADGAFNVDYPPANPYAVVRGSVASAVKRLADSNAVVRPWLQAFDDYQRQRLPYRNQQIADQIRGAEEAGASGWMLWDPFGRYLLDGPPQLGG